jgi:uncharacterized repeat protein (TIGR01451 family)
MKIFLITLLFMIGFTVFSNAQSNYYTTTYNQGDVFLEVSNGGIHDSDNCSTSNSENYHFIIQNSFVGDEIMIKDEFSGQLFYTEINTTGASPWDFNIPFFYTETVLDFEWQGGYVWCGITPSKVIRTNIDTLHFINNDIQVFFNNPCSYGTVSGKVYKDFNNNCIFDSSDTPLNGVAVNVDELFSGPSSSNFDFFYDGNVNSNINGNYSKNLLQSFMVNYTLSIAPSYSFIFPPASCMPLYYTGSVLPYDSIDFALQCSGLMDVRVFSGAPISARPALPFMLYPRVNNIGCLLASGQLKLVLDSQVTYNATLSSHPADSISGDTLIWNYTNLSSLGGVGGYWNSFLGGIHLTPDSLVNIGDTLCFYITSNIPVNDINTGNNQQHFCIPIVNSYDPNIKEVVPKGNGPSGFIPEGTGQLEYTIHFQNTGNAPAINISVIDTLEASIIPGSLIILNASHAFTPSWLAPNIVKFYFPNIQLPDSTSNEAKSHGFVSFKVNIDTTLVGGSVIKNKAGIYFDTNPPIITNSTINTIDLPLGFNMSTSSNGYVSVYPNPLNHSATFNWMGNSNNENVFFELKNVLGQTVKSMRLGNVSSFEFHKENLESGIYIYKISSQTQEFGTGKIIIE